MDQFPNSRDDIAEWFKQLSDMLNNAKANNLIDDAEMKTMFEMGERLAMRWVWSMTLERS